MAWTLLAHSTVSGAATTSSAIDTSGAVLLVVLLSNYYQFLDTAEFSDSAGNTWTAAAIAPGTTNEVRSGIFYVRNPATSAAHTITTGADHYPALAFHAWGGVTSPALDQTNSAGSSSARTLQPGSITPTQDGELLLTALSLDAIQTATVDSGFSLIDSMPLASGTSFGLFTASLTQVTAAAIDPTWSTSNNAGAGAAIASFKGTASGGGTTGTSRASGSGRGMVTMAALSSLGVATRGRASGTARLVIPPLPIGLGGPGRGPRPQVPVRGVFRHRWRRYRLSYRSVAISSGPVGWARSRAGGTGALWMTGLTSLPLHGAGGSRGRLGGTTAELIVAVARGIAAAFARLRLPGAASGTGRVIAGARARSLPAGFLGGAARTFGAAAGRLAGVTGAIVAAAGRACGASGARAAMAAAMTGRARSDAAARGRARMAGAAAGTAHTRGAAGGRLAPTLGALLAGVLRAGAAGTGRLSGMTRAIANGALRGAGAAIGRLSMAGAGTLAARGSSAGRARAMPDPGIVGRLRAAGANWGAATAIPGRIVTGAMRAASGVVGRAAWRAAGAIEARTAGSAGARAAMLGVLGGWMRGLGVSFGEAEGGADPLEFDQAFWMLPPVTGLTMTALPAGQNAGPYA